MINIIIFSKNRACQLEFLLRSMHIYWPEVVENDYLINVIYTATDENYSKGYEILKHNYSKIKFISQTNFKQNVIDTLNINNKLSVFFVDDNVFKCYFSLKHQNIDEFYKNNGILCISLRMHPNINFCYTENRPTPAPQKLVSQSLSSGIVGDLTWNWKGLSGDWGYPMSLDGHIFRTHEIEHLVKNLNYSNPNTMEAALASCPLSNPLMVCYINSIIMNIPMNKVQTVNNNRHGNVSAEFLNNMFLQGTRLSLAELDNFVNTAAHQEITLKTI